MIELFDIVLPLALVAAAVLAVVSAARSFAPFARIVWVPSTRIADLRPGVAEVAGTARVRGEPIKSLANKPLAASRRRMHFTYRSGDETYSSAVVDDTVYAAFDVVDATGACGVEVDRAIVIGPWTEWTFGVKSFAERQPKLFQLLGCEAYEDVQQVFVEETTIGDGEVILVSGVAKAAGTAASQEGYRGAREGMTLVAPEDAALILSGWDEAGTRRRFARPVILAVWMALLAVATLALLIGAGRLIDAAANL
jgi:hypothetical protein